jgi:hypothetical protein
MRVALLTERISRNDVNPGVRPQPEDMLEDATQGGARGAPVPSRRRAGLAGRDGFVDQRSSADETKVSQMEISRTTDFPLTAACTMISE